jgi:predicted ATP-grasp superfamily ATP-dependent carboligase
MPTTRDWKVLVTDGDALHSLAIVRSLGQKGMKVTMASHRRFASLSFYSRYCHKRVIYPNPEKKKEFVDFLIEFVRENQYEILLPVRSTVTPLISEYQKELKSYVDFVIPSLESMEVANNKEKTFQFAEKIGIPIPQTAYPKTLPEVEIVCKEFKFPIVMKSVFGSGSKGITYVNSPYRLMQLCSKYFQEEPLHPNKFILQEFIPGEGYGFFAIFDRGEPKGIFMHHRLREYPITGGPSSFAESIYDERLKELGLKILSELNWNGVAMVEFKLDNRNNQFKLMEINPKFWGSLNLAIASGVDFPYLFCLLAKGEKFEPVFKYKQGVKFRWLFPNDFMYFLAHYGFSLRFYKDFFDKSVKYDISFSDIKPNIFEVFLVGGYLIQNKGKIRYPQGKPRIIV